MSYYYTLLPTEVSYLLMVIFMYIIRKHVNYSRYIVSFYVLLFVSIPLQHPLCVFTLQFVSITASIQYQYNSNNYSVLRAISHCCVVVWLLVPVVFVQGTRGFLCFCCVF